MLSVVIPARNERYVGPTVASLLAHARDAIEIIVVIDGPPLPVLPRDARVRVIVHDAPQGMRPSINEGVAVAQGDYLLKCDAHCAFDHKYDVALTKACEDQWVMVPRRFSLDPVSWTVIRDDPARDYHYLSWPLARPGDDPPVLRGRTWHQRAVDRASVEIDDEMTSQGSCWVMSRAHWDRIGPLDTEHYGPFIQEFQEVGLKTWLSGGAVKINKRTWYAHWYKRQGQGYALSKRQTREGIAYSFDHWFFDRTWPGKVRDFTWLIDRFWPVPGWPANWQDERARLLGLDAILQGEIQHA